MCGIMGFIRTSRNTIMTKAVVTNVFREISTRGKDAAGWGMLLPRGALMEKGPYPTERLARWKNYKRNINSINLMVGHARMTTMGTEKKNRNNHPHCSQGLENILVHNGIIYDGWEDYSTKGECDSEILLRAIETHGLKKACKEMSDWYSSSYAWLDLKPLEETVYAYCDEVMPAGYIDLTVEIGGIIIASTRGIVADALEDSGIEINNVQGRFIELKAYHLYQFHLGKNKPTIEKIAQGRVYGRSDLFKDCYIKIDGVYVPAQYTTQKERLQATEWRYGSYPVTRTTSFVEKKTLSDEEAEAKARRRAARLRMISDNEEELAQLNEYYRMQESGYFQGLDEI